MVQRKTTQKVKAKSTAKKVTSSVKAGKKLLSNGFGKTQPKRNPRAKSTKKPAETPEPSNDLVLSDTVLNVETTNSSQQVVPDHSKKSSKNGTLDNMAKDKAEKVVKSEKAAKPEKVAKPGKVAKPEKAAKPEKVDKPEKIASVGKGKSSKKENPGPSKDSSDDNPKENVSEDNAEEVVKSEEKTSSDEGKSRKRKVKEEKEEKTTVPEKKSTLTKSKAKRPKFVLEVPPLCEVRGKVFVVGENDCGQMGLDEDVDSKERPFLLKLPHSFIDVAAGGMHSVLLSESGEVITFGCNDEGALGRVASDEEERIPKRVEIPERIVQVSAGDSHSAALAESGQVYLWGNFRNGEGQMGLTPDGQKHIAPVRVLTGKTIVKIASGGDHLACLSNEGVLYTCGCGEQGQLGRINPRACKDGGRQRGLAALLVPDAVVLKPKKPINDVWTESYATFLKVQETGSIYAFGLNNYNQLGLANRNSDQENQMIFFPQSVPSFDSKSWQQISGGQHHSLALDSNGLVHALGRKDYGRLGLGEDCEDRSEPTVIPTIENETCSSISCGNCVSFAVTEEGSLYSWGMGSPQLGHGGNANANDIHTPCQIKGELLNSWDVIKVSGGGQHALILARPKQGSSSSTDKKA